MYLYIKRVLDFVFSFIGLIILSPLLILIFIALKFESNEPAFFKQKRFGKNKKLFEIYKFRTMKADAPSETPTHLLANPEQYISKIGKFLRTSSLNELPQLINILRGEMSFIGPRPALWNQCDLIDARDIFNANNVLPGLSGWAQVNGRDELSEDEKARFDGEYVNRMSLFFDALCVVKTFTVVMTNTGIVEGKRSVGDK